MAREFQRGHKARISDLTAGTDLYVGVLIEGPGLTFDISCFGLDADERLSDDRYFVFYNQPASPEESIRQLGAQSGDTESFRVTLDRVPAHIRKLSFTATIDGDGQMSQIGPGYVRLVAGGEEVARYAFQGAEFSTERAVMLADVYLKDVWRFAAVGQGFDGGLEALLRNFGGEVAEDAPAAEAAATPGTPAAGTPAAAPPAFAPPPPGPATPPSATPAPQPPPPPPSPSGATPPPFPAPPAPGATPPPLPAPAPAASYGNLPGAVPPPPPPPPVPGGTGAGTGTGFTPPPTGPESIHQQATMIAPLAPPPPGATPPPGAPVPPPAPAPYADVPPPPGPPPGVFAPPVGAPAPAPFAAQPPAGAAAPPAGIAVSLQKYREAPDGARWTAQNAKLMRADLSQGGGGPVLARQGSMVLYQGKADFAYKGHGAGGRITGMVTGQEIPLMRCTGTGQVFFAANAAHLHAIELQGDGICVSAANVLAFDESLHHEVRRIEGHGIPGGALYTMAFTGTGTVVVTTHGTPVVLPVTPTTYADANAVVAWSANAQVILSSQVRLRRSAFPGHSGETVNLQFRGAPGTFVVVQPYEV